MNPPPAIRCADTERSYPEVHRRIAQIANALADAGVNPGDRVGLLLWNSVEFLEVSAGIAAAGALPVPINWHLQSSELAYILADSGCRLVFAHSGALEPLSAALPQGVRVIEVTMSDAMRSELAMVLPGAATTARNPNLEEWISRYAPTTPSCAGALGTGLVYTSGSTGRPKAVVRKAMSAEQGERFKRGLMNVFQIQPGTRTLLPMPMYHAAPNIAAMVSLQTEADITILPRFSPRGFLHAVQDQRIEQCQMVPTMFVRLLELPDNVRRSYDTSTLRNIIHTAGPCAPRVKRAMLDWLGPIVSEYYGATELGAMTWASSRDWLAHPGTVGRPRPGYEVKIIGADGRELPAGEPGSIYVKPADFWPDFTYLGNDDKRRAMEAEGLNRFLTVGDIGYVDEEGFLYISDRRVDMIISGGVNIYPVEIETAIAAIPGVRDVAVFGIPDDEFGESVAAHVDVAPDADLNEQDIRAALRNILAGYKIPRVVVLDNNLPREESGKMFKSKLREHYWVDSSSRL